MSVTTRLTDDDPGLGDGAKALLPLGLSPDDVNCPICVETISAPFVTSCGHTFCYECISTQLKHKNSCPSCGNYLTADNIYPNFLLNKILRKAATAPPTGRVSLLDQVKRLLADNMTADSGPSNHPPPPPLLGAHAAAAMAAAEPGAVPFGGGGWLGADVAGVSGGGGDVGGGGRRRLQLRDIDAVLEALYDAREDLERRESSDVLHLLLCFLEHAREQKARQMDELRRQLALLQHDITSVLATKPHRSTSLTNNSSLPHTPVAPPTAAAAPHLHFRNAILGPVNRSSPLMRPDIVSGPCPAVPPKTAVAIAAAATVGPKPSSAVTAGLAGVANLAATATPIITVAMGASLGHTATATAAHVDGSCDKDAVVRCLSPDRCFPSPAPPVAETCRQRPSFHTTTRPKAPDHPEGRQQHLQQQHSPQQQQHQQQQELQQQQRRPCPPIRRASWRLHTLTPGGGISSITLDTSGLTEPGQQAEAFCAAVQHALAAARGTGASVSTTTASDGGARGAAALVSGDVGGSPKVRHGGGGDASMAAAQTPTTQRLDYGNHDHGGVTGAVRGCTMSTEAVLAANGGGGPSRRMPRCGSADNFQMVAAAAAGGGGGGCSAVGRVRVGEQPSSSSCDGTGDSTMDRGGAGTGSGAGGGGDDCSPLSGAAFPPPRPPMQPASEVVEARAGMEDKVESAAAKRSTTEVRGNGMSSPSLAQVSLAAAAVANDEAHVIHRPRRRPSPPSSSEDEMDVRERRRGRGRPAATHNGANTTIRPQQTVGKLEGPSPSLLAAHGLPPAQVAAPPLPMPLSHHHDDQQHQQPTNRVAYGVADGGVGAGEEGCAGGDEAGPRAAKRRRMLSQFDLLERAYLQMRVGVGRPSDEASALSAPHTRTTATSGQPPANTTTTSPAQPLLQGLRPRQTHPLSHYTTTSMPPPSAAHNPHLHPHHHPHQHHYQNTQLLRGTTLNTAHAVTTTTAAGTASATAAATFCDGAHPHRPPSGPDGRCNCEGHMDEGGGGDADLSSFGAILASATQYSRLELLAEIPNYASGGGTAVGAAAASHGGGGLQILSSIEFDLSDDLFATAGVVPRILVYDHQALLTSPAPPHPVVELTARSKLSCLSFSHAVQSHLLAADYQGGVSLWDTSARMQIQDYEAHEQRVWVVDFSPARQHCFASGSDDGMVKIWSTRQPGSCLALELRGNVCSVEWHPTDPNLLAVGSALHAGFVYDVRQPAAPLHTLLGHRKAVSYVRWLSNGHELVTASTDSSLKLWSLNTAQPPLAFTAAAFAAGSGGGGGLQSYAHAGPLAASLPSFLTAGDAAGENGSAVADVAIGAAAAAAPASGSIGGGGGVLGGSALVRSFSGHVNERNFVGLSTRGDYIACGSENHEVFVYTRALPQPALRFACNGRLPRPDRPGAGAHSHAAPPGHFVTALQWRRSSPHLLAANSAGYIWVLGMRL